MAVGRLAALSGRVAYHIATEQITSPRPVKLQEVPPTPEHLTDEWLTLALCDGVPGARVVSHQLGARNDGTTSRRTLRVEFNDVGREAGLTECLFTKSAPGFPTRLASGIAGLGVAESTFYAQIRPMLKIEAPTTQYSGYDPITNRLMLILDDITQTRGATIGNILTRKLSLDSAEKVVDTLAALHVTFWNAPLRNRFGNWLLDSYDYMVRVDSTMKLSKRILLGFERAREVIDPGLYARRREVPEALMRSLQINTSGPQTLLHGDVHPGNWYVTGDGHIGLYDWQCIVRGGWARDVAYALSTHLAVEDRRDWEHDLIARYCERIAEAGCKAPSVDDAFLAYRQQMPHGMMMWLTTIGFYKMFPDMQPKDITLETIRRTCQAAADLESLDAIAGGDHHRVLGAQLR